MKKITMYTDPLCNYCEAAKRLLTRNNAPYTEIDISKVEGAMDEMIKKANGKRTIPQIFFDEQHIGGYDEVRALELLLRHSHLYAAHQKKFVELFFFHLLFLSFHPLRLQLLKCQFRYMERCFLLIIFSQLRNSYIADLYT